MMDLIKDKNWVVAGLGMTGKASVNYLAAQGANVKCWDTREALVIPEDFSYPVTLGDVDESYWTNVDALILSPGISPTLQSIQKAKSLGVEILGDMELFARISTVPAFGITGSNGKTTVTLLLTHILSESGFRVTAAGNVGRPVLETLEEELDFAVLELSSFQLETTQSLKLRGATLLNISDDHLDRHGTMKAYTQIKQSVYKNCETAVYWRGQQETMPTCEVNSLLSIGVDETHTGFGYSQATHQITYDGLAVVDMRRCKLLGRHNILNIQAALALATLAGIAPQNAAEAVYRFVGAPHRCTEIGTYNGIRFIDDSKATNVGATVAAIDGLQETVEGRLILVAGGDAKGADLSVLAPVIDDYVDQVIALGRDGSKLAALSNKAIQVNSMQQAVKQAFAIAKQGDVVLLSPACASIDMFENYQHRARVFADAVIQEAGE